MPAIPVYASLPPNALPLELNQVGAEVDSDGYPLVNNAK